ncbi:filamentous hemagglutinin N-terminal domain-containing protein [Helicobacter pullorum]|uniref:filamentous hemagglutinin N-terminal domain-containing protein n=1 Tax=Helicobacter pullorum TaxID=35818 RepID=UPI0008168A12|nr:filamentous hemagglutinin N-terminal domain-containing protein [Helicobacter pullorum]OCR14811.1 hypothetical protein BA915_06610 [Helicobacter pullorum]
MNITGNNTNHIIAWGGGFNINKGESVNFLGNNKSYLNLDYTNKASQILGNLNGNDNNIYLVNPSGVLIGQNASINANKFVASNIIDDTTLNSFKTQTKLVESFSPVFKPNKGNIVNLGTIKANNGITLIGNEVVFAESAKLINQNGNTQNNSITLIGNELDMRAQYIKGKVITSIEDKASIQISTTNLYGYENFNIERQNYNGINSAISISRFKAIATIGKEKGNNAESLRDWYYFAKGWNEGKNQIRDLIDDFVLLSDIDFGKNEKISLIDGTQLNFSGNYADPNGDDNYDDSMIVGGYKQENWMNEKVFFANFDGNNHTLSNIDIDVEISREVSNTPNANIQILGGVFGSISSSGYPATIKNFIIDNININLKGVMPNVDSLSLGLGGVAGRIQEVTLSNIILKKVDIRSDVMKTYVDGYSRSYLGGFVGDVSTSTLSNIILKNVNILNMATGGLSSLDSGGFAGYATKSEFSNISLESIGTINSSMNYDKDNKYNKYDYNLYAVTGGFIGNSQESKFLDITLKDVTTISSNNEIDNGGLKDYLHAYSGGFAGLVYSSEFSDLLLENIGTIKSNAKGNGNIFSSSGGFVGYGSSKFSNINVKNIGTINSFLRNALRDTFDMNPFQVASGGFVGRTTGNSEFSNIFLENIGTISSGMGEGDALHPYNIYSGGFVGQVDGSSTFSNIVLNNIRDIGSSSYISGSFEFNSYSGGFAGAISDKATLSNIVLNNIGTISSNIDSVNPHPFLNSYSGGFVGDVGSYSTFSNIVLNNIGIISSNVVGNSQIISSSGGFVGSANNYSNSNLTFENIYLYFDSNSTILAEAMVTHNGNKTVNEGKFYGGLSYYNPANIAKPDFSNIHLYYKNGTLNSVDSDSKDYYHSTNNPNGQIFLHTYSDSSQGIRDFSSDLKFANSSVFKDNPISWKQDSNGNYNYYFANSVTSTPTPPNINDSTTNTLPTLDIDNLFNKGGYFDSSSWLTKDSFNQSILNEILENLSFDILSLITDTNSLESALQSLDFLLHFINADKSGESGISLGNGIYGLMGYTLNQSQIDLLNSNNLLITQKLIGSINSLSLEDKHYIQEYKQKLESYQAKAKEFEESLKVISSDKHQALIEAFKQENGYYSLLDDRDRAEKIIKTAINNNGEFNLNNPYKIANGINVSFNLNTIEGINDKDGLNPDFTLPSANSSLFVKEDIEDVLILPAQEKQEAIVEDGKERGRLCIVSDNAKTNNPCMAITY